MELQISLPDLPHESRRVPANLPLLALYRQVTEFGVRLEEFSTRIEWEPFIHLLAAGFWIRQKQE